VAFPVVDGLRAIEFGTPGESRRLLVDLVVNGNKRATAGLLSEYEDEGEPLEHVGERLAVLGDDGAHVATVVATRVEVSRFADVPDEFALAEAEGDLDAADFRSSHTAYWASVGTPVTDDTLVVQLYFDLLSKEVVIRPMRDGDVDAIVELSLRAWEPVFASIHDTVGPRLFDYFYGGDWPAHQAGDIRRACAEYHVTIAEQGGRVVGFTAVDLPAEGTDGEIYMVAVDPDAQGQGVGTRLTLAAVDQIRAAGKRAAVVGTGADPGHAPARATYRKAGFTSWPAEQFYLLLDDGGSQ
jgi:uncharacterized protein YhfF/GNAT superfamily N-acetyltransferase